MDWLLAALSSEDPNKTVAVASLLTAVAAIVTAAATFAAIAAARRTYLANLFVSFSDRYNTGEMRTALSDLARWYKAHPKDFALLWKQHLDRADENAVRLDAARRVVTGYFAEIGRLYHSGLISRLFASELSARWGVNVFSVVCDPMNRVAFPAATPDYSRSLLSVRRSYGDGSIF